ncbi:chromosomal replication initiator protein DnaA [Dialister sp. CAG:588]|nr:chromosomal replication initiator protein DnaA [Dialister sp. CAG:588]
MEQFRRRYRHVDYFLMDDVQLFSGKNSSQVEVFNTFNVLFDNKKHIILTSDRTPQDIEKLEDRIKTRFSSGLIAPIEPPDYEMCSVILLKKAENDNILLPEEVVNYIAGHIHTNVRELNGAYNKLVSNAILTKQEITLENTKELLRDIIPFDKKKELNMDFITDVVCQYYGISKSSVLSKSRPKKIVTPRQMAMYFCRQELNESYPNIRDFFKRKDHTTVMYACERVDEDLKTKPAIKEDYDKIKKILESR